MNQQYGIRTVTKPTPMKGIPELPEGWTYSVESYQREFTVQVLDADLRQKARVTLRGTFMRNATVRKGIRKAYKQWQEKLAIEARRTQMRHVVADNGARV